MPVLRVYGVFRNKDFATCAEITRSSSTIHLQCISDRVLLLRAALTQLSGNEASIAADPETSPILERLVYSMDDFARRVLIDRFTGQYV